MIRIEVDRQAVRNFDQHVQCKQVRIPLRDRIRVYLVVLFDTER